MSRLARLQGAACQCVQTVAVALGRGLLLLEENNVLTVLGKPRLKSIAQIDIVIGVYDIRVSLAL